jgi:hypothetical protein
VLYLLLEVHFLLHHLHQNHLLLQLEKNTYFHLRHHQQNNVLQVQGQEILKERVFQNLTEQNLQLHHFHLDQCLEFLD